MQQARSTSRRDIACKALYSKLAELEVKVKKAHNTYLEGGTDGDAQPAAEQRIKKKMKKDRGWGQR